MNIKKNNTNFRVIDTIPSPEYFVWNIGTKYAPEGYIPFFRLDPNDTSGTAKIDPDNILALPVENETDRKAIMDAASVGICDIKKAVSTVNRPDADKLVPGSMDELAYTRAVTALPAFKKLPWEPERAKYCQ